MAYTVTIYVAAPGTPLKEGGTSMPGHMYYVTSNGEKKESYGFAPIHHGSVHGSGKRYDNDLENYRNPHYSRTIEITKNQYEKLNDFGKNPEKYGFDTTYGPANNCVDYVWKGLNLSGMHAHVGTPTHGKYIDGSGALRPNYNIHAIRSIDAPLKSSPLNTEHFNKEPKIEIYEDPLRWLLSEEEKNTPKTTAVHETELLARHSNSAIVTFHDRVQNESTLASYSETDRSRIAAAACLECQKTGKNIASMTEVECYEYKGKAIFLADDPVKAAHTPYISSAAVDVAKAVDTPVQDSLNQMQSVHIAQVQAQEQAQTRAAGGPVIS